MDFIQMIYDFARRLSILESGDCGLCAQMSWREECSVAWPFFEGLPFRHRLWHCGGVLGWIFILLAIVGLELCAKDAFAFPKAAHALFVFMEDFVEFVGLLSKKPFNGWIALPHVS
jgi:hypothetical protein